MNHNCWLLVNFLGIILSTGVLFWNNLLNELFNELVKFSIVEIWF